MQNRIVLNLFLHEIRASIRNARQRDLAWVFIGGGLMLAYAFGIVVLGIHARSEMLLAVGWIWFAALPAATFLFGAGEGLAMARLTQARAHSHFLKAQPISASDRRRMAAYAAWVLAAPLLLIDGSVIAIAAKAAGQSLPLLWGFGAALMSALGYFVSLTLQLRQPYRDPAREIAAPGEARGVSLAFIDRRRPAWLGSWAGEYTAGHIRPSLRTVFAIFVFALGGLLAATAGFARGSASPAILAGVIGGLVIFMLLLHCRPLLSPVLRASQLGFTRALRGLARLPLLLSLLFFAALAAPAYAAEPGMIAMPLSGAVGLVALNAIYAVFAAFFAHSRRLAVLAFVAALALTAYESLEYGRTVLFGLAALLVFLWVRARGAYRYGR
jgi:hypothetical protein